MRTGRPISLFFLTLIIVLTGFNDSRGSVSKGTIVIGQNTKGLEYFTAREIQRYLYEISGVAFNIDTDRNVMNNITAPLILVGQKGTNLLIKELSDKKLITISPEDPGSEGFVLKKLMYNGYEAIVVAGCDEKGVMYGGYTLLENFGVRFYVSGDILPQRSALAFPEIDLRKTPVFSKRGVLPWYNFLNGPTAWDYEDYRQFIDQLAKMKYNLIIFHVYTKCYTDKNWIEPFLRFEYRGVKHGGYLDTSLTERWGYHSYYTDDFVWGSRQYYQGNVFGSEAALNTTNVDDNFSKATELMQNAIKYAHQKGIKVCIGYELDMIPDELSGAGADPYAPEIIESRIKDVINRYPSIDYIQLWSSEFVNIETNKYNECLKIADDAIKKTAPDVRLVTGGWWQEHRYPLMDKNLPADIIFSQLTDHKGHINNNYKKLKPGREKWANPWFEYDGNLWLPQPYVGEFKKICDRSAEYGIDGLIGIHWRTRMVEQNFAYMAECSWNPGLSPEDFYKDYCSKNFGAETTDTITKLFLDLEKVGLYGVEITPEFYDYSFSEPPAARENNTLKKLNKIKDGLEHVYELIPRKQGRERLDYYINMLKWSILFFESRKEVPFATSWDELKKSRVKEAIQTYCKIVSCPEDQGTLSSLNQKYYNAYRKKEDEIRKFMKIIPPDQLTARVTYNGVMLEWKPVKDDNLTGYNIYRKGEGKEFIRVNNEPVNKTEYIDAAGDGIYYYAVTSLDNSGNESPYSYEEYIEAGKSDGTPPRIIVTPVNTTVKPGADFKITAIIIDDNREIKEPALYYRIIGEGKYKSIPMRNVFRSTYEAIIMPSELSEKGMEYYIAASDGDNTGYSPADAPDLTYSFTVWGE